MTDLPYGWSLDELSYLARLAAATQFGRILDYDEATDVAAVAIIARLYEEPAPTLDDLKHAARHAVHRANRAEARAHGWDQSDSQATGYRVRNAYGVYWHGQRLLVAPFEDDLLDRLAARQLWAALPAKHQETLAALVEGGSYPAARELLGITEPAWYQRLRAARIRARYLWYAPEAPAPQWGRDRRESTPSGRNRGLRRAAEVRRRIRRETAA